MCGRGCGGRDDEAGWLAGCHGGDGRAPSVRTRTLSEVSLGRVSVASLGGANEVVYHPEVVRWSSGRRRPRPLGGQRSLVLLGRSAVSCSRGCGACDGGRPTGAAETTRLGGWVETAGLRLSLGSRFSHVVEFVRRRPPPRPRACTHPEVRRPQCKKSGGRLIGVLRRVNRLMRWSKWRWLLGWGERCAQCTNLQDEG